MHRETCKLGSTVHSLPTNTLHIMHFQNSVTGLPTCNSRCSGMQLNHALYSNSCGTGNFFSISTYLLHRRQHLIAVLLLWNWSEWTGTSISGYTDISAVRALLSSTPLPDTIDHVCDFRLAFPRVGDTFTVTTQSDYKNYYCEGLSSYPRIVH